MTKTFRSFLFLLTALFALASSTSAQGPFISGRSYTFSDLKGPYFEKPMVYQPSDALAPAGLFVGYTSGSIFVGGKKVAVNSSASLAVSASQGNCQSPAYSACNFIYANSSGTVASTTVIGTASAAGNSILAFVTTSGSAVLAVNYPEEDTTFTSVLYPLTSPVVSNPMTTAGDIIYGDTPVAGVAAGKRLGIGSANQLLHGGASAPAYSAVAIGDVTGSTGTGNFVFAISPALTGTPSLTAVTGLTGAVTPSAAGGTDIGSAALPFANIWLGGAATNNAKLTGTFAAARVFTFPDVASDTVAMLAATQGLTNKTLNGNTFTAGTYTLTGAGGKTLTFNNSLTLAGVDGKSLTVNNSLTFAGADATTMTFPGASDTIVGRASTDTFTTGLKTFGAVSAGVGGAYLMATGGTKPTTVSQGGVYWEPTQNALTQGENSGNPIVIGGALQVLTAQAALATITTAQTLNSTNSITLPAGALNVIGKTLHVHGMLVFSNGATTPTVAISLKIGSVVELIPTSAANANNNTNSPVIFDFYITDQTTGAAGTDQAHGYIIDNTANATPGASSLVFPDINTTVSGAWDHTASQTVLIQLTCGGAACTAATLLQATLEIVN